MQNFDYCTPTRLIFGQGVVEKLPEVMSRYGKKILLTYGGGSIKKLGLYDKVKELLRDFEIVEGKRCRCDSFCRWRKRIGLL